MRSVRNPHPRFAAWLIAALLLLAQWGALAHQVEHQAHHPHAPCVVCASADQFGNAMPAMVSGVTIVPPVVWFHAATAAAPTRIGVLAFQSRAPPFFPVTV
jgi:hypothetical protein